MSHDPVFDHTDGGLTMQSQQILQELQQTPWIDVAFLMASDGSVLSHVGENVAFDPQGGFGAPTSEPMDEPSASLYMTSITSEVYLGVLFNAEVPIDDVRIRVRAQESPLASAMGV